MITKLITILILILILIALSGCGICNLNSFVMPDDLEFIAVVKNLDTPEKIGNYMLNNFTYKQRLFSALNPYMLWQIKKGDCNDFSAFGVFIANYHGYETYQIEICFKGSIYVHYLGVYMEHRYSFTDNLYYYCYFDTFKDMVEKSCKYIKYECSSYKVFDYDNNTIESASIDK